MGEDYNFTIHAVSFSLHMLVLRVMLTMFATTTGSMQMDKANKTEIAYAEVGS